MDCCLSIACIYHVSRDTITFTVPVAPKGCYWSHSSQVSPKHRSPPSRRVFQRLSCCTYGVGDDQKRLRSDPTASLGRPLGPWEWAGSRSVRQRCPADPQSSYSKRSRIQRMSPDPPGQSPRPRRARKQACSEPHHKQWSGPSEKRRHRRASTARQRQRRDSGASTFYRDQGAAIQVGLPKTDRACLTRIVNGADNGPPEEFSLESKIGGSVRCRLSLPRHEVNEY